MNSFELLAAFLIAVSFGTSLWGQGTKHFDAATIKPDQVTGPYEVGLKGGPGTNDPGRVTWQKATLAQLVGTAFHVDSQNISGPAWISPPIAQLYTLQATMPPDTSKQDFELMLQQFLIEQFKMSLHHEQKVFPAYELVVAPGGAKLTPSPFDAPNARIVDSGTQKIDTARLIIYGNPKIDSDGFPVLPSGHGLAQAGDLRHLKAVYATFQQYTIPEFGQYLVAQLSPPGERAPYVIEKTGLTGAYDFKLKFDSEIAGVLAPAVQRAVAAKGRDEPETDSGLPSIFAAIEQQLGLKLVKENGIPKDTIVVDHAERIPLGN